MKVKCPHCKSENLDQGIDDSIICHDCLKPCEILGKWTNMRDLEGMK